MRKLSDLATSTLVEHKAFLRADATQHNLNLQMFKKQVIDENKNSTDSDGDQGNAKSQNVSPNKSNIFKIPDDYYGMHEKQ